MHSSEKPGFLFGHRGERDKADEGVVRVFPLGLADEMSCGGF